MERKIYLEGELGAKFGNEYTMTVNSFSEVFRCLEGNFSNFRKYLMSCEENNIGFVCEVAGATLKSEAELLLEYIEGDMVITPLPMGSKSGGAKILAAIAITALILINPGGFFFTQTQAAAYTATGVQTQAAAYALTTPGLIAAGVAINLAMTGIQQMMAPDPSVDSNQDESYLFQGTGQTLVEGDPVPVLYGKLRVPGRPISLQVRNERLNYYDPGTTYSSSSADTANPIVVGGAGGGSGAGQMETEHVVHR
jgi:predicted phage tail protein